MADTRSSPSGAVDGDGGPLSSVLLATALSGQVGRVEVVTPSPWGPVYTRKDQLYVAKARALEAIRKAPVDPADDGSAIGEDDAPLSSMEDPGKKRLVRALLAAVPAGARATFREGKPPAAEAPFIGPLPMLPFITEPMVAGSPADLEARLGGSSVHLRVRRDAPGFKFLPKLGGTARRLVSRLAEPHPLGQVLQLGGSREEVLRQLGRLVALELIEPVAAPAEAAVEEPKSEGGLVSEGLLQRFLERIAASLDDRPLDLEGDEHRARVAELVASSGGSTHYELLQVPQDIATEEITPAYTRLARIVHPRHVERLQMAGGGAALEVLFERATEAYLALSDPVRRGAYDLEIDVRPEVEERSAEEVEKVRRDMARRNFRRARRNFDLEDFHYAHEHLRSALRLDPQPEHYALLSEIQERNPKWQANALESLQTAIQMSQGDVGFRLRLAALYERLERPADAVVELESILEKDPNQPAAKEALERLAEAEREERRQNSLLGKLGGWLSGS